MIFIFIILSFSLSMCLYNLFAIKFDLKRFQYGTYLKLVKNTKVSRDASNLGHSIKKRMLKLIKINSDKSDKLEVALSRCNINITPEEYYYNAISSALLVALASLLLAILGIELASLGCLLLCVLVYFQQIQKAFKQVDKLNNEILEEIPGFIRSFSYGLESSRDIVSIIQRYRLVSKPALASELDILLANMKIDNQEEALRKFDQRLSLEPISTFVSGIIGIDRGIDYKTFFFILEENMKVLVKENLKREISKRPAKLRKSIISIMLALIILYLVPIFVQVRTGFNIFK